MLELLIDLQKPICMYGHRLPSPQSATIQSGGALIYINGREQREDCVGLVSESSQAVRHCKRGHLRSTKVEVCRWGRGEPRNKHALDSESSSLHLPLPANVRHYKLHQRHTHCFTSMSYHNDKFKSIEEFFLK